MKDDFAEHYGIYVCDESVICELLVIWSTRHWPIEIEFCLLLCRLRFEASPSSSQIENSEHDEPNPLLSSVILAACNWYRLLCLYKPKQKLLMLSDQKHTHSTPSTFFVWFHISYIFWWYFREENYDEIWIPHESDMIDFIIIFSCQTTQFQIRKLTTINHECNVE